MSFFLLFFFFSLFLRDSEVSLLLELKGEDLWHIFCDRLCQREAPLADASWSLVVSLQGFPRCLIMCG